VAAECADDVDRRRNVSRTLALDGDACTGDVRAADAVLVLVGEDDTSSPCEYGGEDEICACAASEVKVSGARCPCPYDCPRIRGCGRYSLLRDDTECVDGARPVRCNLECGCAWYSVRGEEGVVAGARVSEAVDIGSVAWDDWGKSLRGGRRWRG